jgi:hypothetical protein
LEKNANFDAKTTLEPAEYFFAALSKKIAAIGERICHSQLLPQIPIVYLYIGLELNL